jgi:nitrogen fixation NifU-like protein
VGILTFTINNVYSTQVLDHFQTPRNPGEIASPDATAEVENPACGDILKLTLKVAAGRITEARFKAKGCVAAIACGSALTELLIGRTLNEAQTLRRADVITALGSLPQASTHAAHLALDALSAALTQFPT